MTANTRKARSQRARTTPEERAAKVEALTAQLHESVTGLTSSQDWTRILATAAKFHHYSARNAMLLWVQAEQRGMQISRVAGYRKWLELGRQVRTGERALGVLAPIRRQLTADEAAQRAADGRPAYDGTGRPLKVIVGFKVESVFDISQTDGEPLPDAEVPYLVGEGPAGLWDAIAEQITTAGYTITRDLMTDSARGFTDFTARRVSIGAELGPAEAAHILTHELGHIQADHEHRRDVTRAQGETEADSIAYVVCTALGLDLADKSTFYLAGWSKGDPEILTAAVEVIHQAARRILARLEPTEDNAGDDGGASSETHEAARYLPAAS